MRWLRDPNDPAGMWRIGPAIAITLFVALGIAAGVIGLAWGRLEPNLDEATVGDFLQFVVIVLGVIAGGGGSVALVVAYRRQKISERSDAREQTRLFNERFRLASEQLGHDRAAVRLAGVHAMAHLADDWEAQRQMCIDVLCSYLRDAGKQPDSDAIEEVRQAWQSDREVRHTILRAIADRLHLRGSWSSHSFNLTGIEVDVPLDFGASRLPNESVIDFSHAKFTGGGVEFRGAEFNGGDIRFSGAEFTGGGVGFLEAEFIDATLSFRDAKCQGGSVMFNGAKFNDAYVIFVDAEFSDGIVDFENATFNCFSVPFFRTKFAGATVSFDNTEFITDVSFDNAEFSGGNVSFRNAKFSGGSVELRGVAIWPGRAALDLPESAPGLEMPNEPDTPFELRPHMGV